MNDPRNGRGPVTFGCDLDNRADITAAAQATTHKPARSVFVVTLTAPPDRGIHALRSALKVLGRRYGLRCVHIEEGGQ